MNNLKQCPLSKASKCASDQNCTSCEVLGDKLKELEDGLAEALRANKVLTVTLNMSLDETVRLMSKHEPEKLDY